MVGVEPTVLSESSTVVYFALLSYGRKKASAIKMIMLANGVNNFSIRVKFVFIS